MLVIETRSKPKFKKKKGKYISKPINLRTINQGVKSDIIGLILSLLRLSYNTVHWMLLAYRIRYRYIHVSIVKEKEE